MLDLGSGWGRISRVLLSAMPPGQLFAADVDQEMTALVNVSLPGVNALTVTPEPPTVLATGSMDVVVAFSVFSHLSGPAHEAWAREIGRLLRPGGVAAITVLGEDFIDVVEGARAAVARGEGDGFSTSMASVIDDPAAARPGFRADRIQFWPTGGGGVRTDDYYCWAAASRRCVERVWGDAGLELASWRPSGELFSQSLAVLVRSDARGAGRVARRARRWARHTVARSVEGGRARLAAPARAVLRRVRGGQR